MSSVLRKDVYNDDDDDSRKKKSGRLATKKRGKKPKGASTAYNLYVAENRSRITSAEPDLSFGDISKRVSQDWRNLPEEQRRPYELAAQKDKERYEREKASYPGDDEEEPQVRRKKKKNPNAPKKNLNAWMFFIQDVRPQIVAQLGEDGKRVAMVTKAIGERWAKMSAEEKLPFDRLAADDKKRYLAEMEKFNATL